MDTDTIPVSGVDELDKHLDELIADPTLPPIVKLFDDVELQLTGKYNSNTLYTSGGWHTDFPALEDANILPLIPRLLPKITEILQQYQQDPAILCSLAIKLLGPLNFTQILSLASENAIIQAMRSPAPSANILAMTVLEKAAKSPSEAAILAAMKNVVTHFLTQWLSAPQVEVGEKGSKVLGDLLDVDCDTRPPDGVAVSGVEIAVRRPAGQGFMWRRVFHDRDVYCLLLSLCSTGSHQAAEGGQTDQQVSLAQGRLLRILPRLAALNFAALTRTDFPELNQRYANFEGNGGLLHFAALHMIDEEDPLMHLTLVDFFEALLSIQRVTPFSTYKMDTLKKLIRDATTRDSALKTAITSLPERTIPEEADDLRQFIREVMAP
ncbi:Uu.00g055080.m01.CDS01 [Anthostomella pinea]|uniref:Uu.00g055080.m01.CDS01 n=1 Tax=Anthostomella pinea TaxID=933095 RepID=A0AAI8VXZ9_9PEZI|nr:Uu.00g055080.m01.CDS01 [Anthostomella pinea]